MKKTLLNQILNEIPQELRRFVCEEKMLCKVRFCFMGLLSV